jgi:hypothetical protein
VLVNILFVNILFVNALRHSTLAETGLRRAHAGINLDHSRHQVQDGNVAEGLGISVADIEMIKDGETLGAVAYFVAEKFVWSRVSETSQATCFRCWDRLRFLSCTALDVTAHTVSLFYPVSGRVSTMRRRKLELDGRMSNSLCQSCSAWCNYIYPTVT